MITNASKESCFFLFSSSSMAILRSQNNYSYFIDRKSWNANNAPTHLKYDAYG